MTQGAFAWPLAGVLAGKAVGLGDAAPVLAAGGIESMGWVRSLWFLLLSMGLPGVMGLGVGLAAGAAASRIPPARWPAAAALAAAPLCLYDALALFAGRRAATIPGRRVLSLLVFAVAVAAVYVAANRLWRLAAAARAGGVPPRRRLGIALAVLAAAALAVLAANRVVLPRLYPWFHATLGVVAFVLIASAVGLWLAGALVSRASRRRRALLVGFSVTVVASVATAVPQLRRSQMLAFAVHEKTAVTHLLVGLLPSPRRLRASAENADLGRAVSDVGPGPGAGLSGAGRPPLAEGPRRPDADVVLITVDALRADHVGAYGYQRPVTPHIDALARRGVRFQAAYAQAPHTSFSVASILTGKYFPTLARLAPGETHDSVAAILRRYGWKTAAFYPPAVFYVDAQKMKAFEATHFQFEYVKFEYLDAFRRLDQIAEYFDAVRPSRAFLWVHFFEPHEPYDARAAHPFGTSDVDRYDSEIAYVDAAIGRLVEYLDRTRPRAVIILTADHGEEFDEHGGRYHGSSLHEEQIRVPLIIAGAGLPAGVVGGQVELIDIAPTILNLLDIPAPARVRGTDLGPWLGSPPAPAERLPPAFAEVEDKRMVAFRRDKLICDLNWGFCALYDLAADPRERNNVAESQPARAASLRRMLDDWLDGHARFEPLLAQGLEKTAAGVVPRAIERGRLGDLSAAAALAALAREGETQPLRLEAARLVLTLPPRRETAAALATAAAGPDREAAAWAAVGALRAGAPGLADRVRGLLGAAPDLALQAALALAVIGDGAGLPVLTSALQRCDDVLLCRTVILALGRLRDRRAVPPLIQHLGEVQNRREMVAALGDIGDSSAAPALAARLEGDEYVPVREEAARALGKLGGESARAALEKAILRETEPTVTAAARAASDRLHSPPPPPPPPPSARVAPRTHSR